MCEEEIDLDEHWSYTIAGNWRALRFCEDLLRFCSRAKTDDERKKVRDNEIELTELMSLLIDRCYEKLINFAQDQNSRLAYLVLGVFLMEFGGKMTKEVKEDILKYSDWKYEVHQFKTVEEKELRKKYLIEFREKIKGYVDGVHTLVSEKTLSDVYANHGPFDLTPINYDIES